SAPRTWPPRFITRSASPPRPSGTTTSIGRTTSTPATRSRGCWVDAHQPDARARENVCRLRECADFQDEDQFLLARRLRVGLDRRARLCDTHSEQPKPRSGDIV